MEIRDPDIGNGITPDAIDHRIKLRRRVGVTKARRSVAAAAAPSAGRRRRSSRWCPTKSPCARTARRWPGSGPARPMAAPCQ